MAIEIELKVHIPSVAWMQEVLLKQYGLSEGLSYTKKDIYFALPQTPEFTQFRLRAIGDTYVVTKKIKRIDNKIEVSDEIEFEVSDPEAFIRFVLESGYIHAISKVKRGYAYKYNDITIEVSDVDELGAFTEFEILTDDSSPENVEKSKENLLACLSELGIDQSQIEWKTYTMMLRDRQNDNKS